jgi:hypothetical protein
MSHCPPETFLFFSQWHHILLNMTYGTAGKERSERNCASCFWLRPMLIGYSCTDRDLSSHHRVASTNLLILAIYRTQSDNRRLSCHRHGRKNDPTSQCLSSCSLSWFSQPAMRQGVQLASKKHFLHRWSRVYANVSARTGIPRIERKGILIPKSKRGNPLIQDDDTCDLTASPQEVIK